MADHHRIAEAGIFDEDSRVELIRGQIVDTAAIGTGHAGMVICLNRLLSALVGNSGLISAQNPVRLDDSSEPEPDVTVLKLRADYYSTAMPRPSDVLLLIEVADTTLRYDREVKIPLYADSGIGECWLVDLAGKAVEVYREPEGGRYAQVRRIEREDILDIAALPGATLAAVKLFGPTADG